MIEAEHQWKLRFTVGDIAVQALITRDGVSFRITRDCVTQLWEGSWQEFNDYIEVLNTINSYRVKYADSNYQAG